MSEWRVLKVDGHPIVYSKAEDRRIGAEEIMARIAELETENAELREEETHIIEWTHKHGAALVPNSSLGDTDTFGDGMRRAKAQVRIILNSYREALRDE